MALYVNSSWRKGRTPDRKTRRLWCISFSRGVSRKPASESDLRGSHKFNGRRLGEEVRRLYRARLPGAGRPRADYASAAFSCSIRYGLSRAL